MKGRYAFYFAVVIWLLFIGACLCINVRAGKDNTQRIEIAPEYVSEPSGRIAGDDIPARVNAWADMCEQEDYENEKIENALIEKAHIIENCTVTFYCAEKRAHICGTGDGLTATGKPVVPYVTCAVDPKLIPFGASVLVDYGDGSELGYYRASDVGSAIKGNHIDVCVETHQQALQLGKRTATVYWIEEE